MKNLNMLLDFREELTFNPAYYLHFDIITIRAKNRISVSSLVNNDKFHKWDSNFKSNGFDRLLMSDNRYLYIRSSSLIKLPSCKQLGFLDNPNNSDCKDFHFS